MNRSHLLVGATATLTTINVVRASGHRRSILVQTRAPSTGRLADSRPLGTNGQCRKSRDKRQT